MEDGKSESGSIDTQRSMLHHYIDQHDDLEFIAEYVDDNFTGTNFNRPCISGNEEKMLSRGNTMYLS